MKTEKQLSKISFIDTFLYFIIFFISINVSTIAITAILGNLRFLLYDRSWIFQLIFPIFIALTTNSVNRNGILKLTDFKDLGELKNKIDLIFEKRQLIKKDKELNIYSYTKKTILSNFLNLFFREDVNIQYSKDEVQIFAKSNTLFAIESRIKYGNKLILK